MFDVPIWSVKVFGGRLWAVMPEIVAWPIEEGFLGPPQFIAVKGAQDMAMVEPNRFAVGGTFGGQPAGQGGSHGRRGYVPRGRRSPDTSKARLRRASRADQRAGGQLALSHRRQGRDPTGRFETTRPRPPAHALLVPGRPGGGRYERHDRTDRRRAARLVASPGDRLHARDGGRPRLGGHDEGVDVFRMGETGVESAGRILMEGPVLWLFKPRVGDEIAFVSAFGGMGSAEIVPDPDADPDLVRRVEAADRERVEEEMRSRDAQ